MALDARKISAKNYYDYLPPGRHQCGDIWANLPTFGLLGKPVVSGLIVTPACDLSNRKSETVTYLPIVSIREYFCTKAQIPILKKKIINKCSSAKFALEINWKSHEFSTPNEEHLDKAILSISEYLDCKKRSDGDIAALNSASAALRIMRSISSGKLIEPLSSDLALTHGSELDKIISRIVTNSFSTDLHFLPADAQPEDYSGIKSHSVALFRYPLTVPIEALDIATMSTTESWKILRDRAELSSMSFAHYSDAPPIKMLCLSSGFLSDLLSRYVNVFNRLGSPDFTKLTIDRMVDEVKR